MTIGEIKVYKDKKYISISDGGTGSCDGCYFDNPEDARMITCDVYMDKSGIDSKCFENKSIWKEYDEQKKYTIEEFVDCLIVTKWILVSERKDVIKTISEHMNIITDPDYKIYLQLKEKFKNL